MEFSLYNSKQISQQLKRNERREDLKYLCLSLSFRVVYVATLNLFSLFNSLSSTFYFPLSSVRYLSSTLILITFKYVLLYCYVERGNNNLQFLHWMQLLLLSNNISWWIVSLLFVSAEPLPNILSLFCITKKLKKNLKMKEKERTFVV